MNKMEALDLAWSVLRRVGTNPADCQVADAFADLLMQEVNLVRRDFEYLKSYKNLCEDEIARLRMGEFTDEELQGICHNLKEDCPIRFADGCVAYNQKLFGERSLLLKRE